MSCSRSSNSNVGTSRLASSSGVTRDTNASTGEVLEVTCCTKSEVERRSSGTTMAPMRRQPK